MISVQSFRDWDEFYKGFKYDMALSKMQGRQVQFLGDINTAIVSLTHFITAKIGVIQRKSTEDYEESENRALFLSEIIDVLDLLTKNNETFDPENFREQMEIIDMHDAGTFVPEDFARVPNDRKLLGDEFIESLASRGRQHSLSAVATQVKAKTTEQPHLLSFFFKSKPSMDNIAAVITSIIELKKEYAGSTDQLKIEKNDFLNDVMKAIQRRESEATNKPSGGHETEIPAYGVQNLRLITRPKVLNGRVGKIIEALERLERNEIENYFSGPSGNTR